ncbi:MAG: 3-deoxy-D-manno-octulosonate 8-phosphate phosphatase [Chitinophagaceae bacterium]|nr:MAG: 3-deoxy-D-manno-octulosonate 8-phosphate phosphatase [Chitinophagaceae bacterium]
MLLDQFKNVRLFVFDVDGVLTDGTIVVMDDGNHLRRMNVKDGYALQLAVKQGYDVMVISGSDAPSVVGRMKKLGIPDVHIKVLDKLGCLQSYLANKDYGAAEVLYMGDDLPDLEVMQFAGLSCCPSDAVPEIKQTARYISPFEGGEGCVRDVIEKVLKQNRHWYHLAEIASR